MQVTMKYGQKVQVFDRVSGAALCRDLLSHLELRLGDKIPGNAQLVHNRRFLKMNETMEQARLIGHPNLEVIVKKPGGMNCLRSCFRPQSNEAESSRLRGLDAAASSATIGGTAAAGRVTRSSFVYLCTHVLSVPSPVWNALKCLLQRQMHEDFPVHFEKVSVHKIFRFHEQREQATCYFENSAREFPSTCSGVSQSCVEGVWVW